MTTQPTATANVALVRFAGEWIRSDMAALRAQLTAGGS